MDYIEPNEIIDRTARKPPTADQLIDWQVQFRRQFLEAARGRGLQGEIAVGIGTCYGDLDHMPTNKGLPYEDEETSNLHRGTINRGERLPDPDGGHTWHVLGNDLIQLWEGQPGTGFAGVSVCANVIRLIRTDPAIVGSKLPTVPDGFQGEPFELEGLQLPMTFGRPAKVAEYLLARACAWGYWSAVPWSEFIEGISNAEASAVIEDLRELAKLELVRIELRDGQGYAIHFRPAFEQIFLRLGA